MACVTAADALLYIVDQELQQRDAATFGPAALSARFPPPKCDQYAPLASCIAPLTHLYARICIVRTLQVVTTLPLRMRVMPSGTGMACFARCVCRADAVMHRFTSLLNLSSDCSCKI